MDSLAKEIDKGFYLVMAELKDVKDGNRQMLRAVSVIVEHTISGFEKRLATVEKKVGIRE